MRRKTCKTNRHKETQWAYYYRKKKKSKELKHWIAKNPKAKPIHKLNTDITTILLPKMSNEQEKIIITFFGYISSSFLLIFSILLHSFYLIFSFFYLYISCRFKFCYISYINWIHLIAVQFITIISILIPSSPWVVE